MGLETLLSMVSLETVNQVWHWVGHRHRRAAAPGLNPIESGAMRRIQPGGDRNKGRLPGRARGDGILEVIKTNIYWR
jgi:hypothetical protein